MAGDPLNVGPQVKTDTIDTDNKPNVFTFQPAGRDEPVNIRTTMIDGEPWLVAIDAVRALGLQVKADGVQRYLTHLKPDTKLVVGRNAEHTRDLFAGIPQVQKLTLISEAGLYALINRSDKPEARDFQDWVNGTVLPSIRKTGGYLLNEAARETATTGRISAQPRSPRGPSPSKSPFKITFRSPQDILRA